LGDPPTQSIPDEVILFSGGLDSLAGTVDALIGSGKKLALVSHQSSTMIAAKQRSLLTDLRERAKPGSVFSIPVGINKGNEEAVEFTQRTRSFMFAALGLVVARMFGLDDLSFYENGVVSINLPIASHVLGARASRTTHPQFLANCTNLFSLLLSRDFALHNPFLWKTKSEEPGPELTMAEYYVLRAQKLATLSQQAFMANYGQVFRIVEHLPGTSDENMRMVWDLHRRHGLEVVSVVDRLLENRASLAGVLSLPKNCLLSMVISPIANQPPYVDPAEAEPGPAKQAEADSHEYKAERIAFAIDNVTRTVLFESGLQFGGSLHDLIAFLAKVFDADLEAGTFPSEYTFVKASTLAKGLEVAEPSLRKRISRARKEFEKAFLTTFNRQLMPDDIIENLGWHGYRLNPYLLVVKPEQLRSSPAAMSHVRPSKVTSSDGVR
jgi:hypothetical protein